MLDLNNAPMVQRSSRSQNNLRVFNLILKRTINEAKTAYYEILFN